MTLGSGKMTQTDKAEVLTNLVVSIRLKRHSSWKCWKETVVQSAAGIRVGYLRL